MLKNIAHEQIHQSNIPLQSLQSTSLLYYRTYIFDSKHSFLGFFFEGKENSLSYIEIIIDKFSALQKKTTHIFTCKWVIFYFPMTCYAESESQTRTSSLHKLAPSGGYILLYYFNSQNHKSQTCGI